jgi:hypothetical protein
MIHSSGVFGSASTDTRLSFKVKEIMEPPGNCSPVRQSASELRTSLALRPVISHRLAQQTPVPRRPLLQIAIGFDEAFAVPCLFGLPALLNGVLVRLGFLT